MFAPGDRVGPFVVVLSSTASTPARKRRVVVRCEKCQTMKEIRATTLCEKRVLDQQWCQHCRPRKGNPYAWARKRELEDAQAAVRETLAQLRTVLQERDSYQRQLDAIGDAIVPALVHRIEPRLSRHPVTVIMAAGALIANIGEAIDCKFADGDDLLEAVKKLVRERDEARAEVERLRTEVASSLAMAKIADEKHDMKCAEADVLRGVGCMEDGDGPCGVCRECFYRHGYRRGAEAMREACAREASVCANHRGEELADILGALPIPEEP